MDYRTAVAEIRSERDREIERVRAQARSASTSVADVWATAVAAIADARSARDAEIRRLRSEGLTHAAIARSVGCSGGVVLEVLQPDAHDRYNARRRRHWRQRHLQAVGE